MEKEYVISPCGGLKLESHSFEIIYEPKKNKPLIEIAGRHKFTYMVEFVESEGSIQSDKTYDEILEAYNDGQSICGIFGRYVYTISQVLGGITFTSLGIEVDGTIDDDIFRVLYIPYGNLAIKHDIKIADIYPEKYYTDVRLGSDTATIVDNTGEEIVMSTPSRFAQDITGDGSIKVIDNNGGVMAEKGLSKQLTRAVYDDISGLRSKDRFWDITDRCILPTSQFYRKIARDDFGGAVTTIPLNINDSYATIGRIYSTASKATNNCYLFLEMIQNKYTPTSGEEKKNGIVFTDFGFDKGFDIWKAIDIKPY